MQTEHLFHDHPDFPDRLARYLGERAPRSLYALGNLDILQRPALALFCSVKCPGDLILKTYDLARALRKAHIQVIGGFHSPMEKECLKLLLRGEQPVVICPARSIWLRVPVEWRVPLAEGRLLIVSPFGEKNRYPTAEMAQSRNEFVAAIADKIFVAYAGPGTKTQQFCQEMLSWRKPLFTLESQDNAHLIALGARPINPDSFS
jgi:predicted Rossmann fold nucleotide-binding protein DprA/Smf involved in DNA uptake